VHVVVSRRGFGQDVAGRPVRWVRSPTAATTSLEGVDALVEVEERPTFGRGVAGLEPALADGH
jgi:hypothetical protein